MTRKISIITVVFNNVTTLRDTIESVLGQDYENIEYIVIDGGSTDGTLAIIQQYRDGIAKFLSEPDRGMYDAMNKGLKLATGEIIGILHADDLYRDSAVISKVACKFEQTNADSVYGDLVYVNRENTKVIRYWKSGNYKPDSFLYGWMPPHPGFFVKRVVYKQLGGFNLALRSAADYELMLRFIHKHNISTAYLSEVLIHMRVGGMSNASFPNRLRANREDRQAWKLNGLKPYFFTLFMKPLRKIGQYFHMWK